MNADQLVPVVYLGHKERKEDNVARSGVVWHGHGDVQNVTAQQWGLLSAHAGVWARATQVAQAAAASIALGSTAPMPLAVAAPPEATKATAEASEPPSGPIEGSKPLETLLGSDILPAHIQIGDELVQLGTVVAKAHEASGLTVDDWNGLVPQIRDKLLVDHIELLRAPADQAAAAAAAAQGEVVSGQVDLGKSPAADNEVKSVTSTPPTEQPTRRRRGAAAQGEVS